jgi:DNA recombination-dependent growth factor C
MGIFKGSASLARYRVAGDLPPNLSTYIDENIRKWAFQSIEDSTEELGVGWCSATDLLNTDFAYASYWLEPYLVLGMRIDKRKVPGSLLKKYHRMEMKQAAAMKEGRLSKPEREELKERARLQLLTRMPPVSQLFEVLWDTSGGQLWLGSQGNAVKEAFEDLFKRSFSLDLEPMWPWRIAQGLIKDENGLARLEAASPLTLYKSDDEI